MRKKLRRIALATGFLLSLTGCLGPDIESVSDRSCYNCNRKLEGISVLEKSEPDESDRTLDTLRYHYKIAVVGSADSLDFFFYPPGDMEEPLEWYEPGGCMPVLRAHRRIPGNAVSDLDFYVFDRQCRSPLPFDPQSILRPTISDGIDCYMIE